MVRVHDDALAALLARSVRARGPVLAREYIPTSRSFRDELKRIGVKRNAEIEQIITRLKTWDKYTDAAREKGGSEANDFKRIRTARLIAEDAERWLENHPEEQFVLHDPGARRRRQARRGPPRGVVESRWLKPGEKAGAATERLKADLAARDMHSAFNKLAPLMSAASPTTGSKAEIEAEIEFAADPTMISFVGLQLKLETDRQEENKLKLRAECTVTGGAKVIELGRIRFEFGGYLYRSMRRSPVVAARHRQRPLGRGCGTRSRAMRAGRVELGVMKSADQYAELGEWSARWPRPASRPGRSRGEGEGAGSGGQRRALGQGGHRQDPQGEVEMERRDDRDDHADRRSEPDAKPEDLAGTLATLGIVVAPARLAKILDDFGTSSSKSSKAIVDARAPKHERVKLGEAAGEESLFGRQRSRGENTMWVKAQGEADTRCRRRIAARCRSPEPSCPCSRCPCSPRRPSTCA